MRHCTVTTLIISAALLGCGPRIIPTSIYAGSVTDVGAETAPAWASMQPGERVVVSSLGSCRTQFGDSLDALEDQGTPLAQQAWAHKARVMTIEESVVRVADEKNQAGYIALHVRDDGEDRWLRLDGGGDRGCVQPLTPTVAEAMNRTGESVVFTPWANACTAVEAAGQAPRSALLEADAGSTMRIEELVFAPAGATNKGSGGEPWLLMNGGTLRVRADVLSQCFSSADGADAIEPPEDASRMLHMTADRCIADEDDGKHHLACTTTVGVWEGLAEEDALSLRLVRRTLGPVHFLAGRPVTGARWANAVVAVTMGERNDDRVSSLYEVMDRTIAKAMSSDDGAVRMANEDDPAVTYNVHVEVSDIRISGLATSTSDESSQYQDGTRTEPNPKKATARQRVSDAEIALNEAEADYNSSVVKAKAAREACVTACDQIGNALAAEMCKGGCSLVQPSNDGVTSAKSELSNARSALSSTPDTIQVPVMRTWNYTKTHYSRETSATLRIRMKPRGGEERSLSIPLSKKWTDYKVEADAAHNVKGHQPDEGPIRSERALVPFIAKQASAQLTDKLRSAISRATIEQALEAMRQGGAPNKRGYEDVDALAFALAGARLVEPVQRGRGSVPSGDKPYPLPIKAVRLAQDQCVVAVAVAAPDSGATITMRGQQERFGDKRDRSYAAVEICSEDLDSDRLQSLAVHSDDGGNVRWGLYRSAAKYAPSAAVTAITSRQEGSP